MHRIEGQVRGIERMVEEDRYCVDIGFGILDEHVQRCVAGALASGYEAEAQAKAAELLEAAHRFAKVR